MRNYKEFIEGTEETLTEATTKYSFKKDVESVIKKVLAIKYEKPHDWEKTKYYNLGDIQEAQAHFVWECKENEALAQERREIQYKYSKLGPISVKNDKLTYELRSRYDTALFEMQKNRNAHFRKMQEMFGFTWKDKDDLLHHFGSVESNEVAISDTLSIVYRAQFREASVAESIVFRHKKEEGVETDFKEFPECKIGAIYCSEWGYNMVRVDFFQVVGRTGSTVLFKQLAVKEEEQGFNRGYITPIIGKFANNNIFRTKVSNPRAFGRNYMPMHLWNGKKMWFDYND